MQHPSTEQAIIEQNGVGKHVSILVLGLKKNTIIDKAAEHSESK